MKIDKQLTCQKKKRVIFVRKAKSAQGIRWLAGWMGWLASARLECCLKISYLAPKNV